MGCKAQSVGAVEAGLDLFDVEVNAAREGAIHQGDGVGRKALSLPVGQSRMLALFVDTHEALLAAAAIGAAGVDEAGDVAFPLVDVVPVVLVALSGF